MAKKKEQPSTSLEVIEPPEEQVAGLIELPSEGALTAPATNPAADLFKREARQRQAPPARIPIVQIDHKEGLFVLPSGECVQEVAGYPVYYFQTRRFYDKPPTAGTKGMPPDCWSADLLKPHVDSLKRQHPTCYGCPRDQFGTGRDGKSKACGTYTWVFLLNSDLGGNPPIAAVVAPPSSIRVLLGNRFSPGYFQRAQARYEAYEIVWTVFRLQKGGELHYVIDPRMGPALADLEKVKYLAGIRNQFVEFMDQMRGQAGTEMEAGGEE
jgi:hypothetical protein